MLETHKYQNKFFEFMPSISKPSQPRGNIWIVFVHVCLCFSSSPLLAQDAISFNRDVRPILTSRCFACHGPDESKREADLRLDLRDEAVEYEAIVPGYPDQSSLIDRVFATESSVIMPPPSTGTPLTSQQKVILKKWVAQGANYERHWAFEPPVSDGPPAVDSDWPLNGIDNFVLHRLNRQGLQPNKTADRYMLVRRVYLDLIGLPPSVEQADEFVQSNDPQAYENLVDQLLASKHYGERWAQPWLDLARYSDTNGYEKDRTRSIWPYRDWVIRALNDDMPYDQFSIEQLAGDMLDDPDPDQIIATGFHRNTMLNEEGGIDPLEYRYLAMVDRVATTGIVWLGLTTECAQCHTHKYDPLSHTDYYRLMALLNNADEPDYRIPSASVQDQMERAERVVHELESELANKFEPVEGDESLAVRRSRRFQIERDKWIRNAQAESVAWSIVRPSSMKTNLPKLEILNDGSIFSTGDTTKRDVFDLTFDLVVSDESIKAIRLEALPDARLPDFGPGRTYYEGRKGDFFVSEVSATLDGQPIEFATASHDFSQPDDNSSRNAADNVFDGDGSTGWSPGNNKSMRLKLVMNLQEPIEKSGKLSVKLLFERHYTASLGRFRFSTTTKPNAKANRLDEQVENILSSLQIIDDSSHEPNQNWSPDQLKKLEREFLLATPELEKARKKLDQARSRIPELQETMVMQERPVDNPRNTYRHHRGEYLSPKEEVFPGIPALFADRLTPQQMPSNRLEFAHWLVGDGNPLVARVAVNRAWREIFGFGLIRTNDDFGVQAELPTHPGLLDWLAIQLKGEMKWSMKKLHRLIVTSNTYRQSSIAPGNSIKNDIDNRELARGPSFRVSGEVVRDIALAATGAISDKMFGPGVRPPQPASVTKLAYGATNWTPSTGPDRFRRSIYTFKKRTAGFAAYSVFDAPSGETCTAKRNRSNTPLQALTVLNDEMYVELTQQLARRISDMKLDSIDDSLTWMFRCFVTRPPTDPELASLLSYHATQLARLQDGTLDPAAIGGEGSTADQAALAMVARVVMNLDETITKR